MSRVGSTIHRTNFLGDPRLWRVEGEEDEKEEGKKKGIDFWVDDNDRALSFIKSSYWVLEMVFTKYFKKGSKRVDNSSKSTINELSNNNFSYT